MMGAALFAIAMAALVAMWVFLDRMKREEEREEREHQRALLREVRRHSGT